MKVYNSYTKEKETLKTIEDKKIRMYVCGPTVYDDAHLGHARSQIAFDIIYRYLKYRGFETKYISNYTDIDDKMIKRANDLKITVEQLSNEQIASFKEDMLTLNVLPADVHPKATEEIPEMIEFIEKLIEKGLAYNTNGDVFFNVPKYAELTNEYGTLTSFDYESGSSSLEDEDISDNFQQKKQNRADFALWKNKKEGEPSWNSPWGEGRPGWHIECSVMSMKYLGDQIDIHGGGSDLKFPHHTNEIAQSEGLTGKKFCNYWLHNGFVQVNKEKMSKSLGNFFTIKDILKKYDGETIRLFCINTQYRGPIDFSEEALKQANTSIERLRDLIRQLKSLSVSQEGEDEKKELIAEEKTILEKIESTNKRFNDAMDDDFNTSGALAPIYELLRHLNGYLRSGKEINNKVINESLKSFTEWNKVLGILDSVLTSSESKLSSYVHSLIDLLLDVRQDARKEKLYSISDDIRDTIKNLEIKVEDAGNKTIWSFIKEPDSKIIEQSLAKIMQLIIDTRQEFRKNKSWNIADKIRDEVKLIGIQIEDQANKTTWTLISE